MIEVLIVFFVVVLTLLDMKDCWFSSSKSTAVISQKFGENRMILTVYKIKGLNMVKRVSWQNTTSIFQFFLYIQPQIIQKNQIIQQFFSVTITW